MSDLRDHLTAMSLKCCEKIWEYYERV